MNICFEYLRNGAREHIMTRYVESLPEAVADLIGVNTVDGGNEEKGIAPLLPDSVSLTLSHRHNAQSLRVEDTEGQSRTIDIDHLDEKYGIYEGLLKTLTHIPLKEGASVEISKPEPQ